MDTSIWINYLTYGKHGELSTYLSEDLIVTNELILTELLPLAIHRKEREIIHYLNLVPKTELEISWPGIRLLQLENYKYGNNKVGIPDLIISQHCIQNNLILWSKDKHFKLMAEFTKLNLLEIDSF